MLRLPHADAGRRPLPAGRHGAQLRHVPQPRLRPDRRHGAHPAPRRARAGGRRHSRPLPRRRPGLPAGAQPRRAASGRATSTRSAPPSSSRAPRRTPRIAASGRSARSSPARRRLLRMPRRRSRRRRARSTSGSAPVAFPAATSPRLVRSPRPPDRAAAGRAAAGRLGGLPELPHRERGPTAPPTCMLPNVASCRACHGGERTSLPVPSTCAMCHDYHIPTGQTAGSRQQGVPTQGLRDRVRGRPWESTVAQSRRRARAGR